MAAASRNATELPAAACGPGSRIIDRAAQDDGVPAVRVDERNPNGSVGAGAMKAVAVPKHASVDSKTVRPLILCKGFRDGLDEHA